MCYRGEDFCILCDGHPGNEFSGKSVLADFAGGGSHRLIDSISAVSVGELFVSVNRD